MTREDFEALLGGGFKPSNNERVNDEASYLTRTFAGNPCCKHWPMTEWVTADTWEELARKMEVKDGAENKQAVIR